MRPNGSSHSSAQDDNVTTREEKRIAHWSLRDVKPVLYQAQGTSICEALTCDNKIQAGDKVLLDPVDDGIYCCRECFDNRGILISTELPERFQGTAQMKNWNGTPLYLLSLMKRNGEFHRKIAFLGVRLDNQAIAFALPNETYGHNESCHFVVPERVDVYHTP